MTTHNTREVEALREIIAEKHGGLGLCDYMFENTIVPFLHQELQKAREEYSDLLSKLNELDQVGDTLTYKDKIFTLTSFDVNRTWGIIEPNHAELDQAELEGGLIDKG